MPYLISRYRNNSLDPGWPLTLLENTTNSSATSLTFIGKNLKDWGDIINENFLHMLEHFAGDVPPDNPITGQIWYDTSTGEFKFYAGGTWHLLSSNVTVTNTLPPASSGVQGDIILLQSGSQDVLYIHDGSNWVPINFFDASMSPPSSPRTGDFWFDLTTGNLYVYVSGLEWIPVMTGPATIIPYDYNGSFSFHKTNNNYTVGVVEVDGNVVAIFSPTTILAGDLGIYIKKDGVPVILSSIFPNGVVPGMNLASLGYGIAGNASTFSIENKTGSRIDLKIAGADYLSLDSSQQKVISNRPLIINRTDYMVIPTGTSAQRPSTPADGSLRLNTTTGNVEYYYGGTWRELSVQGSGFISMFEESPPLPFPNTNSRTVYNHSLGTHPKIVMVYMSFPSNTGGYTPNDRILIAGPAQIGFDEGSGAKDAFFSVWANDTEVGVSYYSDGDSFTTSNKWGTGRVWPGPSCSLRFVLFA